MASASVSLRAAKAISNGALKADSLPDRIKILNWGENEVIDGSKVILDEHSVKVFYANQRSIGRLTAPLDFNHNTVPGTEAYKADKEPRAIAAYGVPTIIPGDGLWYENVQWTPHGRESAKDYADLSPTPITDGDNRVIGLHSCALTPAGAIVNLSFYSAPNLMDLCAMSAPDVKDPDGDDDDDTKESQKDQDKEAKEKLNAMSAEEKARANAYVNDPYKGIDKQMSENAEYFRKELGLKEGASGDEIMAAIRAKWEGLKKDEQPLPEAAKGSSADPNKRNEDMGGDKTPHGTITYSAEQVQAMVKDTAQSLVDAALKPLSAELVTLRNERDAKAKDLEKSKRDALVDQAGRDGKVIPLSAEEIAATPVALLESMVKNLKPEVPMNLTPLRTYSAGDKLTVPPGSMARAAAGMTAYFSDHGLSRGIGYANLTPAARQ